MTTQKPLHFTSPTQTKKTTKTILLSKKEAVEAFRSPRFKIGIQNLFKEKTRKEKKLPLTPGRKEDEHKNPSDLSNDQSPLKIEGKERDDSQRQLWRSNTEPPNKLEKLVDPKPNEIETIDKNSTEIRCQTEDNDGVSSESFSDEKIQCSSQYIR